jgi:hypothetical protein
MRRIYMFAEKRFWEKVRNRTRRERKSERAREKK